MDLFSLLFFSKIAGSAPNFPHGIIDDLPALSSLALKHNIPFHIDACLGGFLLPFTAAAGFPLPHPIDFTLPGVTSISVDTHKYGFAPKGSSVIMYRTPEIRDHQYFIVTDWPGGVYASPAIAGSRPGALIAGCWAAMMKMGMEGYISSTRSILMAAKHIAEGVSSTPHLKLIGDPRLSVVSFESRDSKKVNIYAVGDLLSRKGWHLNMLQFPQAIHIACTYLTTMKSTKAGGKEGGKELLSAAEELVRDIKEAVEMILKDPKAGNGEVAAIYGTAASVPDRSVIRDVAKGFLDSLTML
jgi:sphinganine-1-phosphate aldolase